MTDDDAAVVQSQGVNLSEVLRLAAGQNGRLDSVEWHLRRVLDIAGRLDLRPTREIYQGDADEDVISAIEVEADAAKSALSDLAERARTALDEITTRRTSVRGDR